MDHGEKEVATSSIPLKDIQFTAEGEFWVSAQLGFNLAILPNTASALDLYDKDKVDIEHVSMSDVLTLLQCDEHGLTDAEAERRLGIFGPNKVSSFESYKVLSAADPGITARGKVGKRLPPILVLHVEPAVVGHGRCRPCRHRSFQRSRPTS